MPPTRRVFRALYDYSPITSECQTHMPSRVEGCARRPGRTRGRGTSRPACARGRAARRPPTTMRDTTMVHQALRGRDRIAGRRSGYGYVRRFGCFCRRRLSQRESHPFTLQIRGNGTGFSTDSLGRLSPRRWLRRRSRWAPRFEHVRAVSSHCLLRPWNTSAREHI